MKIFAIEFFYIDFLSVYDYSDTENYQILTVYRNQSVKSESVEIFGLSLTNDFWVTSVLIFKFLTLPPTV
jgi:hypothetical protein